MRLSKKTVLLMIGLLLGICVFIGGCTTAKKPMTTPTPQTKQNQVNERTADSQQVAKQSATEASKVNGVNDATAVVAAKRIYIGLDVGANMSQEQVSALEKRVLDRVKKMQPDYTVVVTSDGDTVTRIKNVAQGIGQGKPLSSFTNEIQDIDNRMKPRTK